ncbi:unnamed protein product [Lactuca saligna]|uniref:Uncharacterized protein n=1 Tax=Lactuca saligna TaxID=75948 RepID=A0AA35YLQ6_LACSI|nr:unnamed protein product [Lactuca saligna]
MSVVMGHRGDVEATRARSPDGMDPQHWIHAIDHFLTEKHQKQSIENKACRKNQVVKNHEGACKYSNAIFYEHSTLAGTGDDPDSIDRITIFEKVLGARRAM